MTILFFFFQSRWYLNRPFGWYKAGIVQARIIKGRFLLFKPFPPAKFYCIVRTMVRKMWIEFCFEADFQMIPHQPRQAKERKHLQLQQLFERWNFIFRQIIKYEKESEIFKNLRLLRSLINLFAWCSYQNPIYKTKIVLSYLQ